LNDISMKKDQWPADADEAYRHVTHRVLAALLDKSPDASGAPAQYGRQTSCASWATASGPARGRLVFIVGANAGIAGRPKWVCPFAIDQGRAGVRAEIVLSTGLHLGVGLCV
jgi:hypothetical protein